MPLAGGLDGENAVPILINISPFNQEIHIPVQTTRITESNF